VLQSLLAVEVLDLLGADAAVVPLALEDHREADQADAEDAASVDAAAVG
jgi:hypothetical protein